MKANVAWMGSYPSPFESMNEGEYYQIMGGEIVTESEVEWKTGYTYHGADYSAQTSGGKSTSGPEGYGYVTPYSAPSHTGAGFSKATGSEDKPMALAPAASLADDDEDVVNAELLPFPNEAVAQAVISNLFSNDGEEMTEEQYEAFITGSGIGDPEFDDPDMPDMEEYLSGSRSSFQPMFFTYEHDGSFSSYITLKGLLAALSWNAHLTTGENLLVGPEEGDVRWVNHFMDIGALSEDGSQEFSWVKHEEDYVMWEGITPTFVRDGITKLRTLVGA
jgi:hypothetical protein